MNKRLHGTLIILLLFFRITVIFVFTQALKEIAII